MFLGQAVAASRHATTCHHPHQWTASQSPGSAGGCRCRLGGPPLHTQNQAQAQTYPTASTPTTHTPRASTQVVLNTGRDAGDLREVLGALYDELLVGRALSSPAYTPGAPIQ